MKQVFLIVFSLLVFVGMAFAEDSDITTNNLQAMVLSQSSNITRYSLKVDVENKGASGEVYLHVVAKNRDGFQVNDVFFTGPIGGDERKVFTTTAVVKKDIASTIDTWEIDRIRKYSK